MRKFILIFLCHLLACVLMANSPDAKLSGHVIDKTTREHLPYITLLVKGTSLATTTDVAGNYVLKNLPAGDFTLEARFVGYKTATQKVNLKKDTTGQINFELEKSSQTLNEVVIATNRNDASRRLAPTLVSILDVETFDKTNSCTIAEGLGFMPGLRVENNCQNCGFTQVRMNGLDGVYSQILIDSQPVFSALAGVYGLEQIPATMIDRIEIMKGAGSALFGAAAIAGTINIVTKEPVKNSAQLSHSILSIGGANSFDNNSAFSASLVSDDSKLGLMVFAQRRHKSAYDDNGDGFSELPQLNSSSMGFRSFVKTGIYSKLTFTYHHINEFRRGGDRLGEQPYEAFIAEQIQSYIDGGSAKYDILSSDAKRRISIYGAAQLVNRKSYYGAGIPVSELLSDPSLTESERLEAIQLRMGSFGKTKDLTYSIGTQYAHGFDTFLFMPSTLTAAVDYTADILTDRSGYREQPISQTAGTSSILLQNEWKNHQWSILVGGRIDKHRLIDYAIFSPRANIRYNPMPEMNVRLSYGYGFRAPQLFDEDLHVDLASGTQIVRKLSPELKAERSNSLSGSVDWCLETALIDFDFLVEGFLTRLNNPFTTVSQDQPDGTILKTVVNSTGAKVYGANLEVQARYKAVLQWQVGLTLQRSLYKEATKWSGNADDQVKAARQMMRTPDVYGYTIVTWNPLKRLSCNISGKYTGHMLVPYEGGGALNTTVSTPSFFELGWRLAYEIPLYNDTAFEINAGLQNIFNSYQRDFDKGPNRVSTYVYGPNLPRSFYVGGKLSF